MAPKKIYSTELAYTPTSPALLSLLSTDSGCSASSFRCCSYFLSAIIYLLSCKLLIMPIKLCISLFLKYDRWKEKGEDTDAVDDDGRPCMTNDFILCP
jgi:hypothetical protein